MFEKIFRAVQQPTTFNEHADILVNVEQSQFRVTPAAPGRGVIVTRESNDTITNFEMFPATHPVSKWACRVWCDRATSILRELGEDKS